MTPARLFISYSHNDEELRRQLDMHLAGLTRQGMAQIWHDRRIAPGTEWRSEIDHYVQTADVILLLISADFIASDFCYLTELEQALCRHRTGTARIVPVILRPCDWQSMPFGSLQALPQDGRPISSFSDRDEAWLQVACGLRQVISDWRDEAARNARPGSPLPPPGSEYDERGYVPRPQVERATWICLDQPRLPALLRGPERMGKSQVLHHLAASLREQQPGHPRDQVAVLDLRRLGDGVWADAAAFFRGVATRLVHALHQPPDAVDTTWKSKRLTPGAKLERLLDQTLLPHCAGRLILAVDHADAVHERAPAIADDFFGLLRSFVDHAADEPDGPWPRLRLLMALSLNPDHLMQDRHRSPFNVAQNIYLEDLCDQQVDELARLHQVEASAEERRQLRDLVGGHPHLVRLSLYQAWLDDKPLGIVLRDAAEGPLFDDHLRGMRGRLLRAGLYNVAKALARDPRNVPRPEHLEVLLRAGIIAHQRDTHALVRCYRLRYPIYTRLFLD